MIALITKTPNKIVERFEGGRANINIPGLWQAQGAVVGWQSPDGVYSLVEIKPFAVPDGKQVVSGPSYAFDGDDVVETYDVADIPPPPEPVPPTAADRKAEVLAQISMIEAGQQRAVREAILDMPGAADRLKAIDAKISALRDSLSKIV